MVEERVLIAQRIERSPAKAEIEVRFLVGTQLSPNFMKIGVLNECFLNKKHLNRLKALGDVVVFDDTKTEQEATERLRRLDILNSLRWRQYI